MFDLSYYFQSKYSCLSTPVISNLPSLCSFWFPLHVFSYVERIIEHRIATCRFVISFIRFNCKFLLHFHQMESQYYRQTRAYDAIAITNSFIINYIRILKHKYQKEFSQYYFYTYIFDKSKYYLSNAFYYQFFTKLHPRRPLKVNCFWIVIVSRAWYWRIRLPQPFIVRERPFVMRPDYFIFYNVRIFCARRAIDSHRGSHT